MKLLKNVTALLLTCMMFLSVCPMNVFAEEEEITEGNYELKILTFEDENGTYWNDLIDEQYGGKMLYGENWLIENINDAYTWSDSGNTELSHTIPYNYGGYCYWGGGHAVSNYASTDFETYGNYESQLTVFSDGEWEEGVLDRTGGGHNDSDNFAVHFGYKDDSGFNGIENLPALTFADREARVIDHMYVNNTAYFINCAIFGDGFARPMEENDWAKIIAIGYNGEEITGTSEFYLAEGDDFIWEWTYWDLSELGKVTRVEFNMESSVTNDYGNALPAFFAYDDVAVRFEKNYNIRTLTFEDENGTYWSDLIPQDQYSDPLLYGGTNQESNAYKWYDAGNTELKHTLPFNYGTYNYWGGGHAISNYASTDFEYFCGFESQLTVFLNQDWNEGIMERSGGGHNGSDNFAVHYGYKDDSGYNGTENLPALTFGDGKARVIDHMYVNNTTYPLYCYLEGNGFTDPIGENGWVKIIATGYNGNQVTGTSEFYLVDMAKGIIVIDWTKWDLSSLGAVTRVEFNMAGDSDNGYGFSQPAYFAYDDVAVRFTEPNVSYIYVWEEENPDTYGYYYYVEANGISEGIAVIALYNGNKFVGLDMLDIENGDNDVEGIVCVSEKPTRYQIMILDHLENLSPLRTAVTGEIEE